MSIYGIMEEKMETTNEVSALREFWVSGVAFRPRFHGNCRASFFLCRV